MESGIKEVRVHGIRKTEEEIRQEEVALRDIRRKVKGALAELQIALRTLDNLTGKC